MFPCSNKAWGENKVFKILKIQHNLESNFLNHNLGGKGETFCEKVYNKENNYSSAKKFTTKKITTKTDQINP